MVKIKEAIVVEGRYDKNTLSQILDAPILQTNGFGIMNDKEQLEFLRSVANSLRIPKELFTVELCAVLQYPILLLPFLRTQMLYWRFLHRM